MFEKITQFLGITKNVPDDFVRQTILIVDDNETDLRLIQKTVERIGHQALTAENGRIGYEIAKAQKPDLILSDCRMPELDGIEASRQWREQEKGSPVPIIALTANVTEDDRRRCLDAGMNDFLSKPVSPQRLQAIVRQFAP